MQQLLRRKEQTEEQVLIYQKKMRVRKLFIKERQEIRKYNHVLVQYLHLFDAPYFFKTFRMTVKKSRQHIGKNIGFL